MDITFVYKNSQECDKLFINEYLLNLKNDIEIKSIGKNLGHYKEGNVFMDIMVMKKSLFIDLVQNCYKTGENKKLKNYILDNFNRYKISVYEFKGYFQFISSVNSYYKCNMDMLDFNIMNELFDRDRPILTKSAIHPPTEYHKNSVVKNCLVASGCLIEGTVRNSIIFRGVRIKEGAIVKNSIILPGSIIENFSIVENMILDKNTIVNHSRSLISDVNFPLVLSKKEYYIDYVN